jgi:hypothetical protein
MIRRCLPAVLAGVLGLAVWHGAGSKASAADTPLPRWSYYPYYYYPHNYWPTLSPQWPEPPGTPYMRPPAYQAYPPFLEPQWYYPAFQPQNYYRGFHFWLDAF